MGLLDDAIREHLELKRQHGGDPGEIERQEHEALGALPEGEEPAASAAGSDEGRPAAIAASDAAPATEEHEPPVSAPTPEDFAADAPATADAPPVRDDATTPEAIDPHGGEDVASAGRGGGASRSGDEPWLDEPEERPEAPASQEDDVLEETPDFLQETPEHDRLWFEQKPPRGFDWDR